MNNFGQFARLKRTESGITIAQCAQGLRITPDAYLKKEQGNREWSLNDVTNLATIYNIKVSELIASFEDAPT
ncbi:MAG: helix-turn-helix transcriptional regulator [Chloroflexi bacterium]|nr:helix-turn-helix transcriptional regulator [Chloroflexota bacterium]